jgi:hypothetical protein
MRYQIPEDEQERLDQLNGWFTQILCSQDYFDDEKWMSIRLNLSKWKEKGFGFRQENQEHFCTFEMEEKLLAYRIFNYLSEVLLFEAGIKEAALKQKFEQASLFRDLKVITKQHLKTIYEEQTSFINFFKIENESLVLKHIENYFINQHIKERLRK